jgi:hypothetical protein
MKNREVSGLQGASQNVGLEILQEVLFIDKINVLPVTWVRSIARIALECRPVCTRSHNYALDRT